MTSSVVLLLILAVSCFAYNPFYALQSWPVVLPRRFHEIFTKKDSPPFHSPSLQSPINIRSTHAAVTQLPPLLFKDLFSDQVHLLLRNTGTTVEFELPDEGTWKPKMFGGPLSADVFEFNNLHIHWGAWDVVGGEHKINGRRYAIEGHCVHFNSKYGNITEAGKHPDGLAVVAFFGKAGDIDNPLVERVVRLLPHILFPGASVMVNARETLAWFNELGEPHNYFTYPGSLTTPPYSENVIWIVYPKPLHLSSRQVLTCCRVILSHVKNYPARCEGIKAFSTEAQPQITELEIKPETVSLNPIHHEDYFEVKKMVTVKDLFNARVHYGHKEGSLNEHMLPYIFGSRMGHLIFDLDKTLKLLHQSLNVAAHVAYRDGVILFITQSPQNCHMIEKTALECKEFVHTRAWRQGMLTNSTMIFGAVTRLPDLIILFNTLTTVLDQHLAVTEAAKMAIPTIGVVDSNCNPNLITYPIPGNDDSAVAINLYCRLFKEAILRGKAERKRIIELCKGQPSDS